jgi:quinoprotein glucose dehydrogenase
MIKLQAERPRNPFDTRPVAQGLGLYQDRCSGCHGMDRMGHAGVAPGLTDAAARLGADQIAAILKTGRNNMPAFPDLTDQNVAGLLAYLKDPASADATFGGQGKAPVIPPPDTPGTRYWTGYGTMAAADGMPPIGPPWSTITAYDLNAGTIQWQTPLGAMPSLAAKGIKDTGSYWPRGGPVATAGGLVFADSVSDLALHAYDADTGKVLWEKQLEAAPDGMPSVYAVNGREYFAVCARGGRTFDNLPENPKQVVQAATKAEAQGYYAFALPEGHVSKATN